LKGDVDFNYDISVDTAFYKVKAFQTTIAGEHELFGTIINDYQAGIAKVAIIDFGINNSADVTNDLIIDSIYVRTYKETQLGFDLVGQADMLRFTGVVIGTKECALFRATLDYPHTDNYTSRYRVKIRIFGDYE
jgi:hypothetical protein